MTGRKLGRQLLQAVECLLRLAGSSVGQRASQRLQAPPLGLHVALAALQALRSRYLWASISAWSVVARRSSAISRA